MEKVKNKIENPKSYRSSFVEKIAFNWHFLNKFSYLIRFKDIKNIERASEGLPRMSDVQNTTSSPMVEMPNVSSSGTNRGIVNRGNQDDDRHIRHDSDDEDDF